MKVRSGESEIKGLLQVLRSSKTNRLSSTTQTAGVSFITEKKCCLNVYKGIFVV